MQELINLIYPNKKKYETQRKLLEFILNELKQRKEIIGEELRNKTMQTFGITSPNTFQKAIRHLKKFGLVIVKYRDKKKKYIFTPEMFYNKFKNIYLDLLK